MMKKTKKISHYLKQIERLYKHNENNGRFFFRGQANISWDVKAFVFRECEDTGKYPEESKLLNQAFRMSWKYLDGCETELEKMVCLQHYGLKTRLIDFTSNPLMALFFACSDKTAKGCDGVVYYYKTYWASCNEPYAKLIAKLVAESECSEINDTHIESYSKDFGISDSLSEIKSHIEKPCFIYSPHNNSRITAQRGAFLLSPWSDNVKKLQNMNFSNYRDFPQNEELKKFVMIPKEYKINLLRELSQIGIDESTVYPEFEHLLRYLNCEY